MQEISTVAANKIIPDSREELMKFLQVKWEIVPTLTHDYCVQVERQINEEYPQDKEILLAGKMLLVISLYIRNNYKEAMLLGFENLEQFKSINHREGEGACSIMIGACYRGMGDNDLALSYLEKGIIHLNEKSFYRRSLNIGFYQAAEIFMTFGRYEEAFDHFNKSLDLSVNDIWLQARSLNGIGNVYLKQKKYQKAHTLLNNAYDLVKEKNNKILNARMLSDLAAYYLEIKEYQKALDFENKSFEIRKELNLKDPMVTNLLHFYKIYMSMGEEAKAIAALEEGFLIANEMGLKGKIAEIYKNRVDYFEKQKNYEASYNELKNFLKSREAEINASFHLKIQGIKAVQEVEFAKKEADITREKNKALSEANEKINSKNIELQETLDELTRTKISRKAIVGTLIVGITLCLLTEIFVDPLVDNMSYNIYISLAVKAVIAILLKPIDSAFENFLIKNTRKKRINA